MAWRERRKRTGDAEDFDLRLRPADRIGGPPRGGNRRRERGRRERAARRGAAASGVSVSAGCSIGARC